MNPGIMILIIVGGLTGLLTSLYILVSLPVILVWKGIRKVTKGISLTM